MGQREAGKQLSGRPVRFGLAVNAARMAPAPGSSGGVHANLAPGNGFSSSARSGGSVDLAVRRPHLVASQVDAARAKLLHDQGFDWDLPLIAAAGVAALGGTVRFAARSRKDEDEAVS